MDTEFDRLEGLRAHLDALGRAWAGSKHRPHPKAEVFDRWDAMLRRWVDADAPLVLRKTSLRGRSGDAGGHRVLFADNSPANWAFGMALAGEVPEVALWSQEELESKIPLSMIGKWPDGPANLNRQGWKVCHIEPVSLGSRLNLEKASREDVERRFRLFLSPRNMFLIPKEISGAGELAEVIRAVAEHREGVSSR